MISPELTLEESFEAIETALIEGIAWSIPMDFTLRYSGTIPSHSAKKAHEIRCIFHEQLADYWSRDTRLAKVKRDKIRPSQSTSRAIHDVRGDKQKLGDDVADRYYYHEVAGVRFLPLVTTWRFLRCDIHVRIYRYEGAKAIRGGVLDLNGDIDTKAKSLLDGLRMPRDPNDAKAVTPHQGLFFCVLEDDRLVTKLTIETKDKLGKRPEKGKLADVDAFVDVHIYPVGQIKSMNYEMLLP